MAQGNGPGRGQDDLGGGLLEIRLQPLQRSGDHHGHIQRLHPDLRPAKPEQQHQFLQDVVHPTRDKDDVLQRRPSVFFGEGGGFVRQQFGEPLDDAQGILQAVGHGVPEGVQFLVAGL